MILALITYILVAMGLVGCLCLFLTLKTEMRTITRKQWERFEEISERLNQAWDRVPESVAVSTPPRSGLNANRRVLAIRMLRRGEDVSHIVAALGMTRQEVDLLIRVQKMSRAGTPRAGSPASDRDASEALFHPTEA
jgi:hypothetical protein